MSSEEKSKILSIVNRAFQEELLEKERIALKIEDEIAKTKSLLQKLRYAIINHYYTPCSSGTISTGIGESEQKAIHPSLKKLIGKKPLSEIVISSRSTRKAALEAQKEMTKKKNESIPKSKSRTSRGTIEAGIQGTQEVAEPRETSPIVQLTSSRGRDQLRHLIVVGNTSQFLNEQLNSQITHKWMCYIKTKTKVPIEKLVSKVRFYLDPSYKPNNVIDVSTPPFSITKRGYAEFTIQLLIFFKDEVQMKPFKIFHKLVLDKKLTGHQTLGSETLSELWTRNFLNNGTFFASASSSKQHLIDHDYLKTDNCPETIGDKAKPLVDEINEVDVEALNVDSIDAIETNNVIEWIEKNFPPQSKSLHCPPVDVE